MVDVVSGATVGWWIPLAAAVTTGAAAATAAVFTAMYTSRQASERSMHERIWDRKAEAYSTIFGELNVMMRWVDEEIMDMVNQTGPSEAVRAERGKRYRDARDKLDMIAAQQSWLLSEDAQQVLQRMDREMTAPTMSFVWSDELEKTNGALVTAVQELTRLAKAEMQPAANSRGLRRRPRRQA